MDPAGSPADRLALLSGLVVWHRNEDAGGRGGAGNEDTSWSRDGPEGGRGVAGVEGEVARMRGSPAAAYMRNLTFE